MTQLQVYFKLSQMPFENLLFLSTEIVFHFLISLHP